MYLGWRDCVGLVRVRANFWSLIVSCDKTQKVESVGRRVERVPDGLLAGSAATAAIEGSDIKRRKKKSRKKKSLAWLVPIGFLWRQLLVGSTHLAIDGFLLQGAKVEGVKKKKQLAVMGLKACPIWLDGLGGPATIRSDTANLIARELAELYLLLLLLLLEAWMSREDNESDNNISKKTKGWM